MLVRQQSARNGWRIKYINFALGLYIVKNTVAAIMFTVITGLLSGCVPIQFTKNPGISGKVIDSKTKVPVVADVTLKTSTFADKNRLVSVITKEDGDFLISPDQEWGVYIVPMDPFSLSGTVIVQAKGYKGVTKTFHTSTMGPGVTKFGEILLEQEE